MKTDQRESMVSGCLYVYFDERFVSSLRVGYFLGFIEQQKPTQGDEIEREKCFAFSSSPYRSLIGKKTERVPIDSVSAIYKTEKIYGH